MTPTLELTQEQVEAALGRPLEEFAQQCHAASIGLVNSDLFEYARVARGSCAGVAGQHSWVVLDHDVYNPDATIVDVTAWSYNSHYHKVWIGTVGDGTHSAKGQFSIFAGPRPVASGDNPISLTNADQLSALAKEFLKVLGPLDVRGWMRLGEGGMLGWPAREIVEAMLDTPQLAAFVPLDIHGMLTDRNPGGLYLKGSGDDDE